MVILVERSEGFGMVLEVMDLFNYIDNFKDENKAKAGHKSGTSLLSSYGSRKGGVGPMGRRGEGKNDGRSWDLRFRL